MTDQMGPAQPDVHYYPNAGDEPVRLVRDQRRFTVRWGRERDKLSPEARTLLRHASAPVAELSRYGITVFELDPGQDRRDAVPLLNREHGVESAAPVLHRAHADDTDADDVYVTPNFLVCFKPEVTRERIDALNAEHGVEVVEELGYVANGFLLRAPARPDGLEGIVAANAYRDTGLTVWAHPDLVSRRHRRGATVTVRDDAAAAATSYVDRQWHLATARIADAWSLTRGVETVRVAVLDDGMDVDHPELAGKVVAQYDFEQDTDDARPKTPSDNHGTACSGVAVGRGTRAAGAAPGCSLIAVRFPAALGDADEARMFTWAVEQGADVISCSWGPPDGTGGTYPLPGATQAAIHHCVTAGRDGKGTAVCFAAGNGDESVDTDGYSANPDVMAIAASNDHEVRSWYSDYGNAIWVCAPSNGDSTAGERDILTIDRHGADGYNDGSEGVDADYTSTFGGTSSASPLVAGIVGLMLSANPTLTVDQVRTILRDTAHKIDGGYDADGHSPKYGYGRVDAYEAVRSAQAAGHGETPAPGRPSIVGPAEAARSGAAPSFEVDPGGGAAMYYAVEVATAPELLDDAGHGGERTDATFYASWQDSSMQAASPWTLPDAAWERLRPAERLYYRAWFSTSADAWTDVVVTTPDEDAANAPSIALVGDGGGGDPGAGGSTGSRPATITASASLDRSAGPPSFEVDPGDGAATYYAVEVATAAELLDDAGHGGERTESTFYASWQDSPMQASNPWTLPDAAWQLMGGAERLYYRAWLSTSPDAWTEVVVTTPDEDAASAPSILLTGSVPERRVRLELARPPLRVSGSRVHDDDELLWRRRPSG